MASPSPTGLFPPGDLAMPSFPACTSRRELPYQPEAPARGGKKPSRARRAGMALVMAVLLAFGPAVRAQMPPDQVAVMLLDSARRAYNEKNYPFAVNRFREFLGK